VKRIDDARIEGLDLSSWRIAANGAEPVVAETLRASPGVSLPTVSVPRR
jgi:hypothetical protein